MLSILHLQSLPFSSTLTICKSCHKKSVELETKQRVRIYIRNCSVLFKYWTGKCQIPVPVLHLCCLMYIPVMLKSSQLMILMGTRKYQTSSRSIPGILDYICETNLSSQYCCAHICKCTFVTGAQLNNLSKREGFLQTDMHRD